MSSRLQFPVKAKEGGDGDERREEGRRWKEGEERKKSEMGRREGWKREGKTEKRGGRQKEVGCIVAGRM